MDNYYSEEEIHIQNEIDDSKSYTFEYTNLNDPSDITDQQVFSPVFEYSEDRLQTDLDMARSGEYELTYSISDPSGNSNTRTRSIHVQDNIAPVVKLYGQKTMYVDLQSIIDGNSTYYDPGAYAIEDLYKGNNELPGFFDWDTEDENTEDQKVYWSYEIEEYDLSNDTYLPAYPVDSRDEIKNKIEEFKANPPSEVKRYKFHYILNDRAGNKGRATRVIEIRGSPNLYPTIIILGVTGGATGSVPSSNDIDESSQTATLPSLTWTLNVGEHSMDDAPEALTYTDLGGNKREDHSYTIKLVYLELNGDEESTDFTGAKLTDASYFPNFFSSVNYWQNNEGISYFVSGTPGNYLKFPDSDTTNWRKTLLRYEVINDLGNRSVRDVEVRLIDTIPPLITKNTFSGNTIEIGEPFVDPSVTITDLAGSTIISETTIDLDHPQGGDDNATFTELSNLGFWESGDYTITYNAVDEFGNQAETQTLNLNVEDTNEPHVSEGRVAV